MCSLAAWLTRHWSCCATLVYCLPTLLNAFNCISASGRHEASPASAVAYCQVCLGLTGACLLFLACLVQEQTWSAAACSCTGATNQQAATCLHVLLHDGSQQLCELVTGHGDGCLSHDCRSWRLEQLLLSCQSVDLMLIMKVTQSTTNLRC